MSVEARELLTLVLVAFSLVSLTSVLAQAGYAAGAPGASTGPGLGVRGHRLGQAIVCIRHENLTATVKREAYINYSLMFIEDEVVLNATGDAVLSSFLYGIPMDWSLDAGVEFFYLSINGTELEEPWEKAICIGDLDFRGFLLNLTEPLELHENQTANMRLVMAVNGSLRFLGGSDYEIRIPLAPCTSLAISNLTFRLLMPRGAGISGLEPGELTRKDSREVVYSASDLGEFFTTVATVRFRVPEAIFYLHCPSATRVLRLDPLGGIKVEDTYELENTASSFVEKVKVLLPKDASSIKASDLMGDLETKVKEAGGLKEVEVSLRSPLGRGSSLTLTVSYTMPWASWVEEEGLSTFVLKHDLEEGLSWPVGRMMLKVVLPQGASLISCSKEPSHVEKLLFREVVGFTFYLALPIMGPEVEIRFRYSIFWPSLWPTLWASLAGLVGCALVKILSAPAAVIPAPAVPVETIMKFVEAYERRMRLRDELASLREALRKKKISRRKFKTRSKAVGDELARLEKQIASLMAELRGAGGLISELVRDLEVAESELESVERDLRSLEARYTRKEIGSEAYRRLLREYRRREDRAYTAIKEALLRLKELAA